MKNLLSLLLSCILVITLVPTEKINIEAASNLVLRVENKQVYGSNFVDVSSYLDELNVLNEGTIVVRFTPNTVNSIMTLFSLGNNSQNNGHFHFYMSPTLIGSENRYQGTTSSNTHISTPYTFQANKEYAVAMVLDQNEGYKYYVNGELIYTNTTSNRVFLSNINQPNNAKIGHTDRASGNEYHFNGDFELVEVYHAPLSHSELVTLTAPEPEPPILREENKQISANNYINADQYLNQLETLNEGTIVARFRPTSTSSIMSLFSLGNNTQQNGHFHFYISSSSIGSENRYQGATSSNTHVSANYSFKANQVYTVAMVVDQATGYKYYVNGQLIHTNTSASRLFLSHINAPNNVRIGHTDRSSGNEYNFQGDIDFVEVYGEPLTDTQLIALTSPTDAPVLLNPMPQDALLSTPQDLFYAGLYGATNYRIPALLYTSSGTLLAGIDKRISSAADSPANIDINMRRSLDHGDSWGEEILLNNYPGSASNIDQLLLEDTSTQRIFSVVDGFPQGYGYNQVIKGSGFKDINGTKYLLLKNSAGDEFTLREDGVVYNASGAATNYTIDHKRNLYQNNGYVGNVFLPSSPLQTIKTSFLELYYSDDEGVSWTGPVDLNGMIKEEWMAFLGTGPGNGIQIQEGPHAGRLIAPIYFTNENRQQASAVIYSDDGGLTWTRGESPNHGRIVGNNVLNERTFTGNEITESQVVELPGGQLKLFMRNYSGYAQIATSNDGGETWNDIIETATDLVAPYSQMSAIRYHGQIDGKEAVIFSSANHSNSRVNGTIRVGLIDHTGIDAAGHPIYAFDWKYSQLVKEGHYGYSSLSNLANGEIGLFYEGTGATSMSFMKLNVPFLKWDRYADPPPLELHNIAVNNASNSGYAPGDPIQIKISFNDYAMLIGTRTLAATINGAPLQFQLAGKNMEGTEFVFEASTPALNNGIYPLTAELHNDLNVYSAYGSIYEMSLNESLQTTITIANPQ